MVKCLQNCKTRHERYLQMKMLQDKPSFLRSNVITHGVSYLHYVLFSLTFAQFPSKQKQEVSTYSLVDIYMLKIKKKF